jgi:hypothetical protein
MTAASVLRPTSPPIYAPSPTCARAGVLPRCARARNSGTCSALVLSFLDLDPFRPIE